MGILTKWAASKLFAPIAVGLAALFFVGFCVQTVRIDGFPLFYKGTARELAECRTAEQDRERIRNDAVVKAREEGRVKAIADADAIDKGDEDRTKRLEEQTGKLAELAKDLMKPRPVQRIMVENEPPVVITPPMAMPGSCNLNREALEAFRDQLNQGRAP